MLIGALVPLTVRGCCCRRISVVMVTIWLAIIDVLLLSCCSTVSPFRHGLPLITRYSSVQWPSQDPLHEFPRSKSVTSWQLPRNKSATSLFCRVYGEVNLRGNMCNGVWALLNLSFTQPFHLKKLWRLCWCVVVTKFVPYILVFSWPENCPNVSDIVLISTADCSTLTDQRLKSFMD